MVYLLGFFLCMIAVFAAAVGTLIGMSNVSTSERVVRTYLKIIGCCRCAIKVE